MKKIILLVILLIFVGYADAATKIGLDRLNWTQSLPSGEGVKFSGIAPNTTTDKLYSDGGILKFNGSEIIFDNADLDKLNWSQSIDGIKFSGTPPSTTIDTLYSNGTSLLYDGQVVGETAGAYDCSIYKSGSNTTAVDMNGTVISSSTTADDVLDYAVANYDRIYIHAGNYTGISLDLAGVSPIIEGAGKDKTILYNNVNTSPIIDIRNTGYEAGPTLKHLQIKSNDTATGVAIGYVAMTKLMEDVKISHCRLGLWVGSTSFLNDYYSIDISDCYYGMKINSTSLVTTQRFFGGQIRASTRYGVWITNSAVQNQFIGTCIEYNGDDTFPNVYLSTTNASYMTQNNVFSGCWFEDDTFIIGIGGTSEWVSPRGNVIENCHFAAMDADTMCYKVIAGRRNIFSGNYLDSSGNDGKLETVATNAVANVFVNNIDDGSGIDWALTNAGTNSVTTPNFW